MKSWKQHHRFCFYREMIFRKGGVILFDKIDQLGVNTIRTLSLDAIQKANSGHPGIALGSAPMAYTLWTEHLKINPKTALDWPDRDRFILSAGHGSAMLYSLLHLAGYDITMNDLKNFRQWKSKTPGHPERNHTDGVEATTGPLGQGLAMGVGMAMAETHLGAMYNKKDFDIINHHTYVLCGDGDLMEGVSQEASSMAGHMKLGKLIVLYDSNDISLDGPLANSFSESIKERYKAYGWQYIRVENGNNLEDISKAITEAKAETQRPTIIEIKTTIGYGSPKEGTSAVHGAPIGEESIKETKKVYGWSYPDFYVPKEVTERFNEKVINKGAIDEKKWRAMFLEYQKNYPELAAQFERTFSEKLPNDWAKGLPRYEVGTNQASRVSSFETIQAIAAKIPEFWGGSADLSSSNNTTIINENNFGITDYSGRNICFGVREFAMAAVMNGIQLHGGSRVFGGTFFVFVDYLRAAVRLSAIQKAPAIYVLTHDSIAVGEDGPTHEPIEQLASLRCMPGVQVLRPADANETVAAWKVAMESTTKPTVLVLSRQSLPVLEGTKDKATSLVKKGAYVLSPQQGIEPEGILIATGSEVSLAINAQKELAKCGKDVSVVSMPSFDLFEEQTSEYKETVLPETVTKRLAIETGSSFGWERYSKQTITIDCFGASAPGDRLLSEFGFTEMNIVEKFMDLDD